MKRSCSLSRQGYWKKLTKIGLAFGLVFIMVLSTASMGILSDERQSQDQIDVSSRCDVQETKSVNESNFFRVAMQDDMMHLNTLTAHNVWDWNVLEWLMDRSVNRQKISKQPFPWMAKSWNYTPDNPLVASMKLRKGMFWTDHDFDTYGEEVLYDGDTYAMGETNYSKTPGYREVTAYDLEFSYNLVKDAPRYQNAVDPLRIDTNGTHDLSDDILGVTAVDRYTLEYELAQPTADFVMDILAFPIWPEHIWSPHMHEKFTWEPTIDEAVYCGMFTLESWVQDSVIVLKTNEHYWNKSAIPNIDGILYKIYGNIDSAILALQSDEVDFIAWSIQPGYIPTIRENPDLEISKTKKLDFHYLSFNFRNPAFGYDNFSSPERADIGKPLREAVSHCINKEDIVLKLLQGYGTVGDSAVSPANPEWYNTTVKTYSFDPTLAQQVLEDNGYYKVDGWYVSPDGSPIDGPDGDGVIEIIHPPADFEPRLASSIGRMIAEQLTAIGILAENTPSSYAMLSQKTHEHNFEVIIWGWSIDSPDGSYMYDFFRTDPNDTLGGYNFAGYRNSSYDEIVDAMRVELDIHERIRLNQWAQGVIAEDVVYNILYYEDNLETYSTKTWKYGWWEERGGLFNQWTIRELRTEEGIDLTVDIEGPDKLSQATNYTITVVDGEGNPVHNASVKMQVASGIITPENGNTDSNGIFEFVYYPETVETQIAISLKADVTSEYTTEISSMLVMVYPEDAFWIDATGEIDISTPVDYQEALDLGVPFNIRVEDTNGAWLSGAEVSVSSDLNGSFDFNTKNTTIDGLAEFIYTPAEGLTNNRVVTIFTNSSYLNPDDGQTYYAEEELQFDLIVDDLSMQITSMTVDHQDPSVGDSVTLTITLIDTEKSTPVSGATITLDVPEGMTADATSATTDSNGQASFTLTSDEAGTYTISTKASKENYETTLKSTSISFAESDNDAGDSCNVILMMSVGLFPIVVFAGRKRW